jgi:hypothetical protein
VTQTSIGIARQYFVSFFTINGFSWLVISNNVNLDIWKFWIEQSSSYSMSRKIENHVVLRDFTQYPKSNPITTNLDVSWKLYKTMLASIVRRSPPNIDGEFEPSLPKKMVQFQWGWRLIPMQLSILTYPWWAMSYKQNWRQNLNWKHNDAQSFSLLNILIFKKKRYWKEKK